MIRNGRFVFAAVVRQRLTVEVTSELRMLDEEETGMRISGEATSG